MDSFAERYNATLERLELENARLRDLMYDRAHVYAIQHMTESELRIVATNVMEDNAKLRELVADLIKWCDGPCGGCIDYEGCDGVPLFEFWTTTRERARKLGVEVEECMTR